MLGVLGAGFSRTGTSSLKRALEILGQGPCYHMDEVFRRPDHVRLWAKAATSEPDWHLLFETYASAVDAPSCHFWRQICRAFPTCKVILTVRDPDEWYESFYATVFSVLSNPSLLPAPTHATLEMVRRLELERIFSSGFEDKARAIGVYETHNQRVIDTIHPKKLLVYKVSEGWAPLCTFLKVASPEDAFPNANSRQQFRSRVGLSPTTREP